MEDFMEHRQPELPYSKGALAPFISAETLEFHYGKHHKNYVSKLNELIKNTNFENLSLEEIIKNSEGPIFNNAGQTWNHSFFWNCMTPAGGGLPKGKIAKLIENHWVSFEKFKDDFSKQAISLFGSGWTWLCVDRAGKLEILNTSNADNPIKHDLKALLVIDVWEHSYYIDYRNSRQDFVKAFWNVVNWEFVNNSLQ